VRKEVSVEVKCPLCGQTLTVQIVPAQTSEEKQTVTVTAKDIAEVLPPDIKELMTVEDLDKDYIKVKPKQFLGKKMFAISAQFVRDELHGEYVSQGKDSYFKVPKQQLSPLPKP
jgi:uncharacterized Zn finger protein (UPF0148 family)